MKQNISDSGTAGTGFIDPSNNNFSQLYINPGFGAQKFLSKCATPNSLLKDPTIRVRFIGDSILGGWYNSGCSFSDMLKLIFPDKISNFDFSYSIMGGTGSDFMMAKAWEYINDNPDLLVFMEYETITKNYQQAREILRMFRKYTNSDIVIIPQTILKGDMQYLYDNNLSSWKTSQTYAMRRAQLRLRAEFNTGWIDIQEPVMTKLWNNTVAVSYYFSGAETVHPDNTFYADGSNVFYKYLEDLSSVIDNKMYINNLMYNQTTYQLNQKYLCNAKELPDLTDITLSGTWEIANPNTDKSYSTLNSSEAGAYAQTKINGIGFMLCYYGLTTGEIGIKVDDVDLNTLLKDYATMPSINSGSGGVIQKVIVSSNILANAETSRQFRITMTSATQYTLRDVTNSTDIRTGCSISTDESFTVTGGILIIPANYFGVSNFRNTFTTGHIYNFYVKKNWYTTISATNNSLTNTVRIIGLERGVHTVKLICNSGTISLDSIVEYK
jgi:hypothetical protein